MSPVRCETAVHNAATPAIRQSQDGRAERSLVSERLLRCYPEAAFGGFTDVDGTIAFYARTRSLMSPDHVVLDIGCGRGNLGDDPIVVRRNLRIFKGDVRRVLGIDVDIAAAGNPYIDEFRHISCRRWPIDDASVDVAIADCVIEHVGDPDALFSEARRVLRPGGFLCLKTPNAWGYVALVSRLVPNWAHAKVVAQAQGGYYRRDCDVFPTLYRCNTRRKLRAALTRHQFRCVVYSYEAEPSYLEFSGLAYKLGVWHQRYAPKALRLVLFAFGQAQ